MDSMELFDWKILVGAAVGIIAFVGLTYVYPTWEHKQTIIEQCEESEEPEECLANVEANHEECYPAARARTSSRYDKTPNFGFYFECIETSLDEAREKYPVL